MRLTHLLGRTGAANSMSDGTSPALVWASHGAVGGDWMRAARRQQKDSPPVEFKTMPLHPLFQEILNDLTRRPDYIVRDDAQWPDLPDVTIVEDNGGGVHVIHDPAAYEAQKEAEREREIADERERLHDPLFNYRR